MQIMTVMVVMFLLWCGLTLLLRGPAQIPPAPLPPNLEWGKGGLGWLAGTQLINIAAVAIIVAFGHSLLAMSGFETLAQVYREIETPKIQNLKRTANITRGFPAGLSTVAPLLRFRRWRSKWIVRRVSKRCSMETHVSLPRCPSRHSPQDRRLRIARASCGGASQ